MTEIANQYNYKFLSSHEKLNQIKKVIALLRD